MIWIGMIGSVFFLFLGILFLRYPAKYGSNTGINIKRARKTVENWDFAQRNGPTCIIRNAMINIVFKLLLLCLFYWKSSLKKEIIIIEVTACFIILFFYAWRNRTPFKTI